MQIYDTKQMSSKELVSSFFDNVTEARLFFKEKIESVEKDIAYLKAWIKGWIKEMGELEGDWNKIIGTQAIRLSDNYKQYEKKLKEIERLKNYYKISLQAFSSNLTTGYKPDKFTEMLEVAKSKSIVDLISQFTEIKKNKCSCLFHSEKTPSMHIYPNSNTFHCFSCKISGDPITFVMKKEGLSFVDAVKFLYGR